MKQTLYLLGFLFFLTGCTAPKATPTITMEDVRTWTETGDWANLEKAELYSHDIVG